MAKNERITALERLFRKCPDVLTPYSAAKWLHKSKNTIYELVKEGKLVAYQYRGGYIISKADLIEYMAATTDDSTKWDKNFGGKRDD